MFRAYLVQDLDPMNKKQLIVFKFRSTFPEQCTRILPCNFNPCAAKHTQKQCYCCPVPDETPVNVNESYACKWRSIYGQ